MHRAVAILRKGAHSAEMSMEADAELQCLRPVVRAGLIGRGIQQSRTPQMHKAEGARLGLSYEYRLFDFDRLTLADSDLPRVIAELRREDYAGLNVTHPFKEQVVAGLDCLSPEAAAIGAVNTVVFENGRSVGYNTDCWGFAESFRRDLRNVLLDDVVLIGAGGAGMAVGKALLELGIGSLSIFDIDRGKMTRLVESLQACFRDARVQAAADLGDAVARADGLVNATPMGMAKHPGMPIQRSWLRPALWVVDIVYFPRETELLRAAKMARCQTLPGAGMAIFQAVKAFELITGIAPDPEQMSSHFGVA